MSYKWFKHWQNEHPNAVVLIETRAGYLSYEESAFAVYRLTSQPFFTPERRERVKGLAILVPRKEFPGLLDRLMRCRVSHLVAREDYLVYQKDYNERYYQIYAAPIESAAKAEECRLDRPVGIDDRVTVKNLETHKECVWTLVPDEEADEGKREKSGPLSADSAVGKQLIGCFSGEDVAVTDEDGVVTKYRIQLAIDRDGRKLKKHRRAAAEDEPEEEAPAAPEAEAAPVPAEEAPVEKAAEEAVAEAPIEETEPAEPAVDEVIEPAEAPLPEVEQPAIIEEPAVEAAEPVAEEQAAEIPAAEEAAVAEEPATIEEPTVVEEPAGAEKPAEVVWEESDVGTPFFRRKKKGIRSVSGAPQHFATPDRPVPPELLEAGKRPKARHFRTGKRFGNKNKSGV